MIFLFQDLNIITLFTSATDDVDLECESSIGNVFATILECEAEFELVDIQCIIDGAALENCKLRLTLIIKLIKLKSFNVFWYILGSFPLAINRLDFSEDEHILRINVRDSRGETDSYELQFSGVLAGNLPGNGLVSLSSLPHPFLSLSLSLSLFLTLSLTLLIFPPLT